MRRVKEVVLLEHLQLVHPKERRRPCTRFLLDELDGNENMKLGWGVRAAPSCLKVSCLCISKASAMPACSYSAVPVHIDMYLRIANS